MPAAKPQSFRIPVLGQLLTDAVRLLRRDFYQRAQGIKLTPALARLLYYVHHESGSSQVELAARLEVTPVTCSRMIDRLVKAGYVRRVADAKDRRAFRVYVNRAAQPLVRRMAELSAQTTARATRGMSARDQARLSRQLEKLCQNLGQGSPT